MWSWEELKIELQTANLGLKKIHAPALINTRGDVYYLWTEHPFLQKNTVYNVSGGREEVEKQNEKKRTLNVTWRQFKESREQRWLEDRNKTDTPEGIE